MDRLTSQQVTLTEYDSVPEGLLQCSATQLHQVLSGPSLIRLPGLQRPPLFVSVLLHGNEATGWDAARQLLLKYQAQSLPRSLWLFIGNVVAARDGLRHLSGEEDFNRIWKVETSRLGNGLHPLAQQLFDALQAEDLFAAVDIHNNSGKNPHYACVNSLKQPYLQLALLFSRTVVYFIKPDTVMSMAMSSRCPAVTVECGQPGQAGGLEHALNFLQACLQLPAFASHPAMTQQLEVFHTVAIVKLRDGISVGFGDEAVACNLIPNIDRLNFSELPVGTALARVREADLQPFIVSDEKGEDVSARFFEVKDHWILTRTAVMPSMLTLERDIIQQDCLCYLLERKSIR